MKLVSFGAPELLSAMGVESVAVGCKMDHESIAALADQVHRAREQGLECDYVGTDWNMIEKTIDDPSLVDTVLFLLDTMAEHGLTDLMVSCGLKRIDTMPDDERRTYTTRYVDHMARIYARADELGRHVDLHSSIMPGIFLDSVEAWDRWFERFPAKSNAMLLCVGCTQSAELETQPLIDRWFDRIRVVHMRNVTGAFRTGDARDVRIDSGALDLPSVFGKLAAASYKGAVMPEHFPEFPCENGMVVSQGFSLGYCRGLIQAAGRLA